MLLVCSVAVSQLLAQDRQISGTVRDDAGQTMPGANVLLKGSAKGTTTDGDGRFKLNVPGAGTLVVSSVGFMNKEVAFSAATTSITVDLAADTRTLNEVVVTALGIERSAKSLTYSTQKIDGKALTDVRDANFVNTLSGKVAGIVVTQGASGPGSATRVILRGNRSIRGNNNALFVIDGVPIDNTVQGQASSDFGATNGSDGASNINPDDIESMNILKGPAASALYGSRAANGVIMITTKKGKSGKVAVDINSGVVVENPMLLPQFQNEFGQGNGGIANPRGGSSWGPRTSATFPNNVRDFFRTAVSTNNSFGVTAGSEKIQTYMSYTNNYNQGIIPNNDLKRHTLNLRISTQISKRFSTDAKITYMNQSINNKPYSGEQSGSVMSLYKIPRSVNLEDYKTFEDANGLPTFWTTSSIYMNPYWTLNRTSDSERRNRVTLLGSAKYQLTDWLSVQGRVSIDRYDDRVRRSASNRTLLFSGNGGSFTDFSTDIMEQNFDLIISGNNKINSNLSVNYDLGAGDTYRKISTVGASANGLLVPNRFDLSFARNLSQIAGLSETDLQYVFGRAAVSYKDYLTLEGSVRQDWSSTLPAPYSYLYASVGANLVLSDAIKMPTFISFAKLRGSWAQVGNATDPYLLTQTYSFSQGGTGGFVSRDGVQPAANLKPEISSATEVGLDLRLFGGRLGLDLTYYSTNTVNQLLTLPLAPASGFSSQFINAGKINNKGIEIQLTGKILRNGPLTWDMAVNFARNTNKIVELHPDIKIAFLAGGFGRTAGPVVAEGGSFGDMFARAWATDAQGRYVVDANGKPRSGVWNFDNNTVRDVERKIGNFNPDFTLGISNQFNYKNFTASFLFDGRFGGTMTSGSEANFAFDGNAAYTTNFRDGGWVLPAVTATGETNTKAINAETFWTTVSNGRYSWGEFFTYSTTNVRLREMSIGYNIPMPASIFIKNARLSLVGRNLFFVYRGYATLDIPGVERRKLPFDPDVNIGAGALQGAEYGNLPSTRTIGFNLKLGF